MVDTTLPTRAQLQKTKLNLDVINAFINSTASTDITTPDGGKVTPLQVISSIVRLINTNELPSSTVLDTNQNKTQDVINADLISNKADAANVYAKTETLSTAEIQALYPDVTALVTDVKHQLATWMADQGDPALNDVLTAVVVNALTTGKIGGNLVATVTSLAALANVTVWNGRTIYVKGVGTYVYDVTTSQWLLQTQKSDTISDFATKVGTLIAGKADQETTYTMAQVDTLLANVVPSGIYTKTETDGLLATKADKATTAAGYGITDVYTKAETLSTTEVNNLINSKMVGILEASTSYDCPDLASMAAVSTNVSLPGVTASMKVMVGLSNSVAGLLVSATVTAAGMVSVSIFNFSPATISLGTITITVTVIDDVVALIPNVTYLTGSNTYLDTILSSYANASFTVTVPGALVGMAASANFSTGVPGIFVSAYVSAPDTVSVTVFNPLSTTLTLTPGTIYVGVLNQVV